MQPLVSRFRYILPFLGPLLLAGCHGQIDDSAFGLPHLSAVVVTTRDDVALPQGVADGNAMDFQSMIAELAARRVVFVGEQHDQYHHHLNQLAVIEALHARDQNLAIGLEYFQRPFQEHLDRYVAGEITDSEMLRATEYYKRWVYDYRLYAPILRFARQNRVPLVALNLPPEITGAVARSDTEELTAEQRAQLPGDIDRSVPGYEARLRRVFSRHPATGNDGGFERFVEAQLLWDEGMADRAAAYLGEHPQRRMVILAGTGHVGYGTGIPVRLERRLGLRTAIVVNDDGLGRSRNIADYLLVSDPQTLPPAGLMGVYMKASARGVLVESFSGDSAAQAAGLLDDDLIIAVDDRTISSPQDVKLAMWEKAQGEVVSVRVERGNPAHVFDFMVTLR
jgi:uncharacterized iron-regulated protein